MHAVRASLTQACRRVAAGAAAVAPRTGNVALRAVASQQQQQQVQNRAVSTMFVTRARCGILLTHM